METERAKRPPDIVRKLGISISTNIGTGYNLRTSLQYL